MNLENILVVPKMSKYEWDMQRDRLTSEQLLQKYQREQVDIERILSSHERQKKALERLKAYFPEKKCITRDALSKKHALEADAVISLGGDNHLQFVSHYLKDTPVIGVNSDPELSVGALTSFTADTLIPFLSQLEKDDFSIEEWTRLEASVDRNPYKFMRATSEYFLGEKDREEMSRHILEFNGKREEQKGSGLLVATGVGSTGWYNSASRYLFPEGDRFQRNAPYARFILTEPYGGKQSRYQMLSGTLQKGEELVIYSLNDTDGRVSADSLDRVDFNRGARAVIKISDTPLRVIKDERVV